MKITYIINARIPTEKAHGYQICKMCEEFALAGADVVLYAPTRINSIEDDAFSFYKLKQIFKIKYLKSFDFIRYDKFFFHKSVYLQSFWFFIKLVFENIDKESLVYTRNPELVWLFNLRGFKTVYECHDWFGKKKRIALWFLRGCNNIVCTNNYIKNEFIKNDFNKDILVAPNGVNLDIFNISISREEAIEKLGLNDEFKKKLNDKKIILYTGSFRTMGVDKGIDEILKAIKILDQANIFFVAVGGNDKDIAYYQNLASEIGVLEKCQFVGRKTQVELALWQKAAEILLMPFPDKAHYRHYMTPLKIFEYMASGRTIIASDLPSIREILDEKMCVFVRPGDAHDLAEKIKNTIDKNNFSLNAEALNAVQKYTWETRVKNIFDFISK